MEPSPFLPLTEGRVPGTRWTHHVRELGGVRVPSGRLEASDPFVNLGEGLVTSVPPGDHPVRVTYADVSEAQDGSHLREAYLSVVVAEGAVARTAYLVPEGQVAPPDGEVHGVPVDAGTVAFCDAGAVATGMPEGDWYEGVFDTGREDSWFALMDAPDHLVPGSANITPPRAQNGENVVLAHSGWGDGVYPLVATYDADDRLLAVHIDLLVDEEPDATAPA